MPKYDLKEKAEYTDFYYLKGRKRLENDEYASICQEKDSIDACARLAINKKTEDENYFIKMRGGEVVDPYAQDLRVNRRARFTYKRVDENLFNMYVKYLQNGAIHLIRNVERNIGG